MANGQLTYDIHTDGSTVTTSTSQTAINTYDVPLGADIKGRLEYTVIAVSTSDTSQKSWKFVSSFEVNGGTLTIRDTTPVPSQESSETGTGIGSPTFDVAAVSNDIALRVTPANTNSTRWSAWMEAWFVEEDFV